MEWLFTWPKRPELKFRATGSILTKVSFLRLNCANLILSKGYTSAKTLLLIAYPFNCWDRHLSLRKRCSALRTRQHRDESNDLRIAYILWVAPFYGEMRMSLLLWCLDILTCMFPCSRTDDGWKEQHFFRQLFSKISCSLLLQHKN